MQDLINQRRELTDALANCESGAFPGSAARRREMAAMMALDAFDKAHPEVIAQIRAADRERHVPAIDRAMDLAD